MTIKEFRVLSRKAGRNAAIKVKIGDKLLNTDINQCGFQIDEKGNVSLIIGAKETIHIEGKVYRS